MAVEHRKQQELLVKMYHSVANTKLPSYKANQLPGVKLTKFNDIVDMEDFDEDVVQSNDD